MGWMFRGTTFATLCVICALSGHRGPLMQMARIIGAAADLSEKTSDVAVSALNATTLLASGAGQLVLQAAANGLTTGANWWKGVDLQDLEGQRCHGQLLVDGPNTLTSWLNSSQAKVLIPCLSTHLTEQLVASSESLSLAMPMTQTAIDELDLNGSFWSTRVWATFHSSGRCQVTYDTVQLSFLPVWSNPLWRGLPLGSEREQILGLVRQTLVDLPRPAVAPQPMVVEIQTATPLYHERMMASVRRVGVWLASLLGCCVSVFLQSGGFFAWMNGWLHPYYFWCTCYMGMVFAIWFVRRHHTLVVWRPEVNLAILDGLPVEPLSASDPSPISVRSVSVISSEESYLKVDAIRNSDESGASGTSSLKSFQFVSPAQTDVSV